MKLLIYSLILFSFIVNAETTKKKTNIINQEAVEAYSLLILQKKYVPQANKELSELERKKTRYETGLAKLAKSSRSYKTRKAEYDVILKTIKAKKIIIVYTKTFKTYIEEKQEENFSNVDKHEAILAKLKTAYLTESGEDFPNVKRESIIKLRSNPSKRRSSKK